MKNLIRPATSAALVTVLLALTLLTQPQLPTAAAGAQDGGQAQHTNRGDKGAKIIRGESVKAYVQQLRKKDKALDRALKDMERWGKLPDWESSAAIREAPKAKKDVASVTFRPASFAPQEQYWSDGSGNEMIVITAYGDSAHWDGTVYTYDANTGETSTYNGIVNDLVSNDPETSDVVDELYYPPDGSAPIREGGGSCSGTHCFSYDTYLTRGIRQDTPGKAKITNVSSTTAAKPVGFVGWLKRYFRCIKRCTALATQTCFQRNTNNFRNFFVCLAIGGTAASISCAFNTSSCS